MEFNGQYLTFEEYKSLDGTLEDKNAFNLLEYEARKEIDKYTFGRLIEVGNTLQEVKLCEFKVINTLQSYNASTSENKAISSESVGSYSISYNNDQKSLEMAKNDEIKGIIKTYFANVEVDNVPVLYVGVR